MPKKRTCRTNKNREPSTTTRRKPLPTKKRITQLPPEYTVLVLPAKEFFKRPSNGIGHFPKFDDRTHISTIYLDKVPVASIMHEQKQRQVEISEIKSFGKIEGRDAGKILEEAIIQDAQRKRKRIIRTYRRNQK